MGSRFRELEEIEAIFTISGWIIMVFLASAVGIVGELTSFLSQENLAVGISLYGNSYGGQKLLSF